MLIRGSGRCRDDPSGRAPAPTAAPAATPRRDGAARRRPPQPSPPPPPPAARPVLSPTTLPATGRCPLHPDGVHHLQRAARRGVRQQRRGVLRIRCLPHRDRDQHRDQPLAHAHPEPSRRTVAFAAAAAWSLPSALYIEVRLTPRTRPISSTGELPLVVQPAGAERSQNPRQDPARHTDSVRYFCYVRKPLQASCIRYRADLVAEAVLRGFARGDAPVSRVTPLCWACRAPATGSPGPRPSSGGSSRLLR